MRFKIVAIVEREYEVKEEYYKGFSNPEAMLRADIDNFLEEPENLFQGNSKLEVYRKVIE
jgi:hypothetical protein